MEIKIIKVMGKLYRHTKVFVTATRWRCPVKVSPSWGQQCIPRQGRARSWGHRDSGHVGHSCGHLCHHCLTTCTCFQPAEGPLRPRAGQHQTLRPAVTVLIGLLRKLHSPTGAGSWGCVRPPRERGWVAMANGLCQGWGLPLNWKHAASSFVLLLGNLSRASQPRAGATQNKYSSCWGRCSTWRFLGNRGPSGMRLNPRSEPRFGAAGYRRMSTQA